MMKLKFEDQIDMTKTKGGRDVGGGWFTKWYLDLGIASNSLS